MIRKILCFFGFHVDDGKFHGLLAAKCLYCGKIKTISPYDYKFDDKHRR